ncbi:SMC-Scp complex subunit ScpB [Kocuria coralli]|uniref:SMC-Scp complex subunit ScpB n=1 Tax=Kocuria coralli TaxID=1461025 RepID=A0A5J5KTD8_9MICC|nr:SMC-Scp complex subunit ScpB [Kocuria coralli]
MSTEANPATGPVDVDTLPGGLAAALEAILMVADRPVSEFDLSEVLGVPVAEIRATLDSLRAEYDGLRPRGAQERDGGRHPSIDPASAAPTRADQEGGAGEPDAVVPRGFELRKVGGGWRFYSRSEFASVVQAFVLEGQTSKLSQAATETLAVVAYRQPVSRARVSAIRGVNVDGVIRTLVARGLLAEVDRDPITGALLYATTPYFLEKLGLDSLEELPRISPHLPGVDQLDEFQD